MTLLKLILYLRHNVVVVDDDCVGPNHWQRTKAGGNSLDGELTSGDGLGAVGARGIVNIKSIWSGITSSGDGSPGHLIIVIGVSTDIFVTRAARDNDNAGI